MRRCLEAGLVEGKRLTVDGTAVRANTSSQSRVRRQELGEVAKLSKTVREYLAEVEEENPVTDPGNRHRPRQRHALFRPPTRKLAGQAREDQRCPPTMITT